jgi:hypothetical protein
MFSMTNGIKKFLIGILACACSLSIGVLAASVTVVWDGPLSGVVGYRLYYGTVGGTTTNVLEVTNVTSATITGLVQGLTYHIRAKSIGTNGTESLDFSNIILHTVPQPTNQPTTRPSAVKDFQILKVVPSI